MTPQPSMEIPLAIHGLESPVASDLVYQIEQLRGQAARDLGCSRREMRLKILPAHRRDEWGELVFCATVEIYPPAPSTAV